MTLREAIEQATTKAARYGTTRLVIERTDDDRFEGTNYYTIKATEKRLWTPGERCLVIVLA